MCNAAKADRKKRKRQLDRDARLHQHLITAQEKAGDDLSDRHLYDDAAQRYHKALSLPGILAHDAVRITEKLRRAYYQSSEPSAAAPFADWLAQTYLEHHEDRAKASEALKNVAIQLVTDSRAQEALRILAEASAVVASAKSWRSRADIDLYRVQHYRLLDLTEDASKLLATIPEPAEFEDVVLRQRYYREKGILAATLGQRTVSYGHFERAIDIRSQGAGKEQDYNLWMIYANAALQLGDINRAQKCLEIHILEARERQIDWGVALAYAQYASLLRTAGHDTVAREYILKANAYSARAGSQMLLTAIALPLGLELNDSNLLMRFADLKTLSQAFRDGNPTMIGSVAAAFSELYVSRGQYRRAKDLLHRASAFIRGFHENWDVLLAIARYGSLKDAVSARDLFSKRLALPDNGVAEATRELFDAYVDRRHKHFGDMRAHATTAMRLFDALRWHRYADMARGLVQTSSGKVARRRRYSSRTMNGISLTPRERDVAELMLRGESNRAIASELAITENTVEKHVSAIIARLGIRSRHQLAEALQTPD